MINAIIIMLCQVGGSLCRKYLLNTIYRYLVSSATNNYNKYIFSFFVSFIAFIVMAYTFADKGV